MRDKDRIRPFLNKLGDYWEKVSDWRFGQLIVNVLGTCNRDPFFYEDDDMMEVFEKFFRK